MLNLRQGSKEAQHKRPMRQIVTQQQFSDCRQKVTTAHQWRDMI
jgi:hypothetical protein